MIVVIRQVVSANMVPVSTVNVIVMMATVERVVICLMKMSANTDLVMSLDIVPTPLDLTSAHAGRVTQEMDIIAKILMSAKIHN